MGAATPLLYLRRSLGYRCDHQAEGVELPLSRFVTNLTWYTGPSLFQVAFVLSLSFAPRFTGCSAKFSLNYHPARNTFLFFFSCDSGTVCPSTQLSLNLLPRL